VRFESVASGTTADLLGVAIIDAQAAVAVGRRGTVLRWDGRAWSPEHAGTDEDLYAVCAAPDGALYAVGGNLDVGGHSLICRHANGAWTVVRSPVQSVLLSVAADDNTVRACGFNGALVERTSSGWCEIAAPTNAHLFSIASTSLGWFACGLSGVLVEWPSHLSTIAEPHLTSIAGHGADLLAVGFHGTILRRRDSAWQALASPSREHLWSIAADADGAVAVGSRGTIVAVDDATVAHAPSTADLHGVAMRDGLVVAVGRNGTILHATRRRAGRRT
jgi:hypothetical protein